MVSTKIKKRNWLFPAIGFFVAGFCLLMMRLTQPTIKSKKDLVFVTGQLNGYDFHDGTRGTHVYTFKIAGYKCDFQIKADFLGLFDKASFEAIEAKEVVTTAIARQDSAGLSNPHKRMFVYSLTDRYTDYLDVDAVIVKHNGFGAGYGGVAFILLGIGLGYYHFRLRRKEVSSSKMAEN